MTGVPMTQAGIQPPLLAFVPDDDVFPFESVGHLFGKSAWWVDHDRHVGVEIVDSAGQRWVISGLVHAEPPKRRWWQSGRSPEPEWEIELQPLDAESFVETRRRVELQASRIFDERDGALAAIRAAPTMADLSHACFEITLRAQARRILAGDQNVPLRPPAEVARRAIILLAFVRMALGASRREAMSWAGDDRLFAAVSPTEAELLAARRWSDQQRLDAGWNIEALAALLWALDMMDMPPAGETLDFMSIAELVPPYSRTGWEDFMEHATLRPGAELAATAEQLWVRSRAAEEALASDWSDETANVAKASHLRCGALTWVLNPDRLSWE